MERAGISSNKGGGPGTALPVLLDWYKCAPVIIPQACGTPTHSLPLFNFVMRGAFINYRNPQDCPSGGISGWTSIQDLLDRCAVVASTLADIGAQDSCLFNVDNISRGAKVALPIIVVSDNLHCKLETFC